MLTCKIKNGVSPLYIAVWNGHERVVGILLKHPKIDAKLKNKDGWFPLYIAAKMRRERIVEMLLKHPKTNSSLQDKNGRSALDTVFSQMKRVRDPQVWDKYHAIWQLLVSKGGKLFHFRGEKMPTRPKN